MKTKPTQRKKPVGGATPAPPPMPTNVSGSGLASQEYFTDRMVDATLRNMLHDRIDRMVPDLVTPPAGQVVFQAGRNDGAYLAEFGLKVACRERAAVLAIAEIVLAKMAGLPERWVPIYEQLKRTVLYERGPLDASTITRDFEAASRTAQASRFDRETTGLARRRPPAYAAGDPDRGTE